MQAGNFGMSVTCSAAKTLDLIIAGDLRTRLAGIDAPEADRARRHIGVR
jgi:hypothetical protein